MKALEVLDYPPRSARTPPVVRSAPDMTATKPQIPTTRCRLTLTGEIDRAPPALVRDIDRILLDHGIDLPRADIKAALAWLLSGSYGDAIGGPTSS